LLVLESVAGEQGSPGRLVGAVSFVGHPQRVVIDVDRSLGFAEHIDVSFLIAAHAAALGIVVAAMVRWQRGDVTLPCDLTREASSSGMPFPMPPLRPLERAELQREADEVNLVVVRAQPSGSVRRGVEASLLLQGTPVDVVVQFDAAVGSAAIRWLAGPPADDFSPAELEAVRRALQQFAQTGGDLSS
jgi:hypothetical protein